MERPYLTAELPGIGGDIKRSPEDFVVEEVPAYDPCGEGEHLFLWIEKHDVSAEDLTAHVAGCLGISRDDVGVAGLKDRRAVTRQYISVPARSASHIGLLDSPQVRVLRAKPHRNKLRSGHLRGNRFEVTVRDVAPEGLSRATAIAGILARSGFPNYFGEQRFGHGGETAALGFDLLSGRKQPADIDRRRRRFLLRLALSAAQSAMFNEVLAERIADGLLSTVLAGDVMQVVATGGCFVADDPDVEQSRYDARETVLTGPLYGPKMKTPAPPARDRERRVLERYGVTDSQLRQYERLTAGARRPLIEWPADLHVQTDDVGLRFRFTLRSGCYATCLLREFMKPDRQNAESLDLTTEPAE